MKLLDKALLKHNHLEKVCSCLSLISISIKEIQSFQCHSSCLLVCVTVRTPSSAPSCTRLDGNWPCNALINISKHHSWRLKPDVHNSKLITHNISFIWTVASVHELFWIIYQIFLNAFNRSCGWQPLLMAPMRPSFIDSWKIAWLDSVQTNSQRGSECIPYLFITDASALQQTSILTLDYLQTDFLWDTKRLEVCFIIQNSPLLFWGDLAGNNVASLIHEAMLEDEPAEEAVEERHRWVKHTPGIQFNFIYILSIYNKAVSRHFWETQNMTTEDMAKPNSSKKKKKKKKSPSGRNHEQDPAQL